MHRILLFLFFVLPAAAFITISGRISDSEGRPVPNAAVQLGTAMKATTDASGAFHFTVDAPGNYTLQAQFPGFLPLRQSLSIPPEGLPALELRFNTLNSNKSSMTVTADVDSDILYPDPAQRVFVRQETLDANPGRPGAPVSLPGLPIESASGGIKAPQYFAPGVAGDHGEPISQFLRVGAYLVPNNLSSNAHGNGYADPNIMIPSTIESVQVDGGAFNVREGNHSVNVAAIYGFRQRIEPYVTVTGDYRDLDLTAGWSPTDPETRGWLALQASFGNGFLDRLEHRQQYKLNGYRTWTLGRHELTLFGIGYFGASRIPGLIPLDMPKLHDTIDPRQRDQTHTAEFVLSDTWKLNGASELQLSAFFRSYNLALLSNFGDGLIRQSEYRTVTGAQSNYIRKVNDRLSVLAGFDYLRDAPSRLDLDRYESTDTSVYGPFDPVTKNRVALQFLSPYAAVNGAITSWLRYNLGWRRDQIDISNADLLDPVNSVQRWAGVNSPKATINLIAPQNLPLPSLAFSFGQTFFTNDPRIGTTAQEGTKVSRAHSYQLIFSKTISRTDFRVTLGRITQEASLAKISPDTGLQFDEGSSRNYFITIAARRYFGHGSLQASYSQADSRDLSDGTPVPEAPREIFDVLGTWDKLPFHLHGRAEYEEVFRKPLGDGFFSVPVREFRGAVSRSFRDGRLDAGVNFLIASGYTGQTTELLDTEQVVGVRLPSYVSLSVTYRFRPAHRP